MERKGVIVIKRIKESVLLNLLFNLAYIIFVIGFIIIFPFLTNADSNEPTERIILSPEIEEQISLELKLIDQARENWQTRPPRHPEVPPILNRTTPMHVIFAFVDHWENGYGENGKRLANLFYNEYNDMAKKHQDADGISPQHTWFCVYLEKPSIQVISKCVFNNLGEMEIHIHHGTANDDGCDNTPEITQYLNDYINFLQKVGACITAELEPKTAFGFIHGMWALDNSRCMDGHRQYCGCNEELNLLISKKCYGDFTFPAWGTMDPKWKSKICLCMDSPYPKSYDYYFRELSKFDSPPQNNEFLIFEGPGYISTNIDKNEAPTLARMNSLVNANVHVIGRDDWVFVKVNSHCAQNLDDPQGFNNIIGNTADKFYSDIEQVFNDGINYKLHYATSRELYNIAMAAADGKEGDPNNYRDYIIPKPVNKLFFCNAFYKLKSYDSSKMQADIEILDSTNPIEIWAKKFSYDDLIFESAQKDGPFEISDAETSQTLNIPLLVKDTTPSKFYRFQNKNLTSVNDWKSY